MNISLSPPSPLLWQKESPLTRKPAGNFQATFRKSGLPKSDQIANKLLTATAGTGVTLLASTFYKNCNIVIGELAFSIASALAQGDTIATIGNGVAQLTSYSLAMDGTTRIYIPSDTNTIKAAASISAGTYRFHVVYMTKV